MSVRWAIIGATGMIGSRIVLEIVAAENCQLVAIQSLDEDALPEMAKKHGIPQFTSAEEMLDTVECDAVYLCSPQNVHLEHTRLAASRGRHVLCEKPLARNGREAEEMVDACQGAGVKMGTAFNLRFHNLHIKARQLVEEGVVGKVVSARCQYGQDYPPDPRAFRQVADLSGGGSMVDMGNHAMDLVEFVTGKRFHKAMAVAQNVIHEYEVEDALGALLEFEDGGFAIVDTYYCAPLHLLRNDLEINGTKGILYTIDTLRGMTMGGKLVVITDDRRSQYEWDGVDMYRAEVEAFATAVIEDQEPPCDGQVGLHSQQLLDACYESATSGRSVDVP